MISKETLTNVVKDQHQKSLLPKEYIHRSIESRLEKLQLNREIVVLMGIRRSGKSVLIQNIRANSKHQDYYLNFEDERLVNFTLEDFQQLLELFITLYGEQEVFYFDEIQNIPGWEMFIRRLYEQGYKIYITGSNANLFSEELGTRLTGRYISITVYPISFAEFVGFNDPELLNVDKLTSNQLGNLKRLYLDYSNYGGIPEYLKFHDDDYLHSLYESIVYRDIITRYKIANPIALKKLLYYLASNCGKETTYSSLRKLVSIKSVTTIADYCSYIQNSFMCFFVNQYSDSLKAQEQSPKKVYFVDHALAKILGFRISEDYGRMLENIVFIELKRRRFEIYYHKHKNECDFILMDGIRVVQAVQACVELSDPQTKAREIKGLLEVMQRFSLQEGLIITDNDEFIEKIAIDDQELIINVVPVWKWLLDYHK